MRGRARLISYLGFAALAVGLIVILVGWNGAAGTDRIQGQLPYLLSGGFVGLAFVTVGSALLLLDGARRDRAHLEQTLRELTDAVERMSSAPAAGWQPTMSTSEDTVVVGAHSFHRPDCRLTVGKTGLKRVVRSQAIAKGLEPCRICKP
ncbi:MAG: hypothetical protein WDA71_11370 [Actinomycetota bacterium]